MKAKRILYALGSVSDAYIEEMQAQTEVKTHCSPKKLLLIAVIVAVMLFLMGCAVVSMVKMRVSNIGQVVEIVSTEASGIAGTEEANYQEIVIGEKVGFEEVHDVFIELGSYYPQEIPDGYTMTFVSDGAPLSSQHIDYENEAGNSIYYRIYIGSEASNVEIYQIVSKTEVDINGQKGILYVQENDHRTLVWVNEALGYGFALRTDDVTVDLTAMAKSTDIGEPLQPTYDEKTYDALAQLGDYSPSFLPEGFEEQGVMGFPLENGGGWYSYVRKYYVNKRTNTNIYFEYETYVIDTAAGYADNAETVCSFYIPGVEKRGEETVIDGMFGLMTEEDIVWADPERHVVYHLYSKDVTGEALLKVAQSICGNEE